MSNEHVIYIPAPEEPSIFTREPGVVNEIWVKYCVDLMLGRQVVRGKTQFRNQDAVKEFLDQPAGPDPKSIAKLMSQVGNGLVGKMVKANGMVVQANIRKDLKLPLPAELEAPIGKMYNSDRHIKLRWVLHMCREEGMSPEEAHSYGLSLMRG